MNQDGDKQSGVQKQVKDAHCSYCGHPYETELVATRNWPRTCINCRNVSFQNPIPVAVVVQPIEEGILLIRRGIEPQMGKWALPGGYVDNGESWQEAAARELWEETGIQAAPEDMRLIDVLPSSNRVTMLVFGEGPPIAQDQLARDQLETFTPNEEVSEVRICGQAELGQMDWAFSLHQEIAGKWFQSTPYREHNRS